VQFGMDEDVWDGEGGHSDANPEEDESEEMELLWSGPNISGRAKKRSSTFPLFQFGRRIHLVGNRVDDCISLSLPHFRAPLHGGIPSHHRSLQISKLESLRENRQACVCVHV
jgi:hypothetical protein